MTKRKDKTERVPKRLTKRVTLRLTDEMFAAYERESIRLTILLSDVLREALQRARSMEIASERTE